MALPLGGIPVGSSLKYTTPRPVLLNSVYANSTARMALSQIRHTSWDYHDEDTGTHWHIKPRLVCFTADEEGSLSIPVTQNGTWGSIEQHWIAQTSDVTKAYVDEQTRVTKRDDVVVVIELGSANANDHRHYVSISQDVLKTLIVSPGAQADFISTSASETIGVEEITHAHQILVQYNRNLHKLEVVSISVDGTVDHTAYIVNGDDALNAYINQQLSFIYNTLTVKANLVAGVVPYSELPYGLIKVVKLNGSYKYYTNFMDYFTGFGIVEDDDIVYFGAGVFDNSNVNRIICTKAISIILSPQTTWKVKELLVYPGIGTDINKNVFSIDGSTTGKLVGRLLWFGDAYSLEEKREVWLSNLIHFGRVAHLQNYIGPDRPIKLRINNLTAIVIGTSSSGNIASETGYIMSTSFFRGEYRTLDLEIDNSRFYVEAGPVVNHLVFNDTNSPLAPYPTTLIKVRNSVAYLADAFANTFVDNPTSALLTIDYHNTRVKTSMSDAEFNTTAKILVSAAGNKFKLLVDDAGLLFTSPL